MVTNEKGRERGEEVDEGRLAMKFVANCLSSVAGMWSASYFCVCLKISRIKKSKIL